jgi:16S rRNA (cytosine1402-N4)-methyltransferase
VTKFIHKAVMVTEVLSALKPRDSGRYVDGTVGGAGHAEAILTASSPNGWLFGCDRDGAAVEVARERLAKFAGRFQIRQGDFAEVGEWIDAVSVDGVFFDLGVSSPQLDVAERGFSFQAEGPLDMRMNRNQSVTAAELVNELGEAELAKIFWEFGDEPHSRKFARAIVRERETRRVQTTTQLASLIEKISPRYGKRTHPATKIFQALRIAVNDEIGSLKRGLEAAMKILKPGGRLAVITFHSLEDRTVKNFGRARAQDYVSAGGTDIPELRQPRAPDLKIVERKAIKPSETEVVENPRARSAQLRVFEKI